jgi:golgi-specific brefeldin A-resistance guanine nucleotide exchange factor 1
MASAVGMAPIINTNSYPSIDSNMNGGEVDKHGKTFPMDAVDDPTYDSDMLPEDTLKGEEDDDYYNGDVLTSKTGAGRTTKLYRGQNGIKGSIGVSPGSNNALLIQPNNVCKVIKGEIHNVLNAMRADSRYVSPLRFVEELPTDEQHPLLLQMRDLHTELGEWELLHYQQRPEPKLYLKPFCAAIQGRDISASVTGAALHAIHKFLLYGFLAHENPESYATIANTLLLCTFEESGEGASARTRITNAVTNNRDDEQVVLKLLDLSALVVRCASHSLDAELIVGLLDTCLHVSHRAKRASPLLKSAASDALGQIVLEVFSNDLMHAREAVLSKLAMLLNPQQNSDAYAVNSLTLVNIALETLQDDLSEREINILSNDLSKYLLQWSTTHDLVILSLTLRVIFNLFQTIRNHLKVPLEVFLTSVHLRILEHSTSAEEREVALESLLEFCQEPALMKDLYLNYDCDVNCTNLYESICTTLGNVAVPSATDAKVTMELDGAMSKDKKAPKLSKHKVDPNKTAEKASLAQAEIPLNALNMFAVDGLTTIIDSIARRCKGNKSSRPADPTDLNRMHSYSSADSLEDDIGAQVTEEELQERKRKKYALTNIAKAFNKDPKGKEWLEIGKEAGIINDTAASVAHVLYSAPGLDKVYIGEYLAKGPKEDYPFEHEVRLAFAKEYDFSNETSFAGALRLYLSKFRMPGEAQCIDRFMEAFSNELYRQQGNNSIFKNADAAFVLAFSTIMLNTDLHNPMIKNISRMTIEQFVKNNRGINDGEDLPEGMLRQLYEEIKANEIQLQREIGEFITKAETKAQDFRSVWGDLLAKNVAAPVFSTAEEARLTMFEAGVHEKDMFLTVAKPAMKALQSAFLRSWDDGTVVNILAGFENMARISTYFSLDKILNDIVSFLLLHGRDYINGVVALEYAGIDSGAPIGGGINDDDDTMSIVDTDSPLPMDLLKTKEIAAIDSKVVDISGAAAYRGIISLNMGLKIVRALFPRIREAWPMLINVFCSLRDARALPEGLADLDDFADSEGNVLPLSKFAKFSQFQLDKMYRGKGEEKVEASGGESKGWFKMFGSREGSDVPTSINLGGGYQGRGEELSSNAKVLLEIAQRTEVEKFMVLGLNVRMSIVKQSVSQFLESADQFPPTPGYAYEQHTAFTLELAARALLMSQERARDLLPMFLAKFTSAIKKCRRGDSVYLPFIVERMVVTVLRTCIHLYSIPAVSDKPEKSLFLSSRFMQLSSFFLS